MKKTNYSPLKIVRYIPRLEKYKDEGEMVIPPHLEINPFNPCNHDCPFCTYRSQGDERLNVTFKESDFLKIEDWKRILSEASDLGIEAIQYCGGGEPMMHPHFMDALSHTKKVHLKWCLVTNGSYINEENVEELLDATWIRISTDASTKETYMKTHRVKKTSESDSNFENIWKSLKMISSMKNEDLSLGASFIMTPDNYWEAYDFVSMVKDSGADNARVACEVYTDGREGTLMHVFDEIIQICEKVKQLEDDSFTVFVQSPARVDNKNVTQYDEGESCWHQHVVAVIGADGNLYSCCIKKYCSDGFITSVLDKSLSEALMGNDRRDYISNLDVVKSCNLYGCFLKPKNDIINYVFSEDSHGSFV